MSKSTQKFPIKVVSLLLADCFLLTTLLPPSGFAQSQRSSADTFLRPVNAEKRGAVSNLKKALRSPVSPNQIALPDGGRRERLKAFLEEAFGARVVDKRVMDGDPDHSAALIGRDSQALLLPGALDGVDLLKAVLEEIERLEELSWKHDESTLYRSFGKKSFPEAKAVIQLKIAEWMEEELAALRLLEEVGGMQRFAGGVEGFLSPGDKVVYLRVLSEKVERIRNGLFGLFPDWERSDLYPGEEGTRIQKLVNAVKELTITLDNASGPFSKQYKSQDVLQAVDQLHVLMKKHMAALFGDSAEVRWYVSSADGGRRSLKATPILTPAFQHPVLILERSP